jgi:hypothetical protein
MNPIVMCRFTQHGPENFVARPLWSAGVFQGGSSQPKGKLRADGVGC